MSKPKTSALTSDRVWREAQNVFGVILGATLCAAGYAIFQVPLRLAGGGLGGLALIVNHYTQFPPGVLTFLFNLPLLVVGYFYLGRWRFLLQTLASVLIFAMVSDFFLTYLPTIFPNWPLTQDTLLSAVYGGVLGGIGGGLVYRTGGTMGGTSILGRILQRKTGLPLSQTHLYFDGVIIVLLGLVFGWERLLYGFIIMVLGGMAADYTLEGPSTTRTATIITDQPEKIVSLLTQKLQRGVSYWPVTGGFTEQQHYLVSCTIYRPQVAELIDLVRQSDPKAFVTIGVSHHAFGRGFVALDKD
jgi:uncharacterized membrane-anchored protein YitT (DUF2179 family)